VAYNFAVDAEDKGGMHWLFSEEVQRNLTGLS
jgi:hypothetical protein